MVEHTRRHDAFAGQASGYYQHTGSPCGAGSRCASGRGVISRPLTPSCLVYAQLVGGSRGLGSPGTETVAGDYLAAVGGLTCQAPAACFARSKKSQLAGLMSQG